jgi:hypothetical protein
MKRLLVLAAVLVCAGCSSKNSQSATLTQPGVRLGAGDELGWRLQAGDRAVSTATAEERNLND